jgi:tRNA nucleotidyltransferase (CCA-adding enzyme)
LLAKSHELQVRQKPPEPILMGRHLIELGLEPGQMFGTILHKAYEAQLEGEFFDLTHAWQWLAGAEGFALPGDVRQKLADRAEKN